MSQSLSRGLGLLTQLGRGPSSLADLAATTGVHKTTVLRLLRTLEAERFVRRDDQHRYSLGSRLFELGAGALEQHAIRDVALPHLARLGRDSGGHTVHLAVLEGFTPVYVAKVEGTGSVRMYSQVGRPAALHATAVGKVLASGMREPELTAALESTDFRALTARTITDPQAYRRALAEVRSRGWAEDAAEHEEFIHCVAAPVHDGVGRTIAAVSICVPEVMVDPDQVRAMVPRLFESTAAIEADWAGTIVDERKTT